MSDYVVARLRKKYKRGEPIVSITAYDYFTAILAREADADFVLVGDSLGNVVQGRESTVPVTLEQVVYHTRIVASHFPAGRTVLDMPFGTFKVDAKETVANAISAFQQSGAGAVKFEGATTSNLVAIQMLAEAGVPVLGHLGLLPQRVHADGGYRMQGRTEEQAEQLLHDARALENAGAFAVVLECVVPETAQRITDVVGIPTIGIGCGSIDGKPGTDGQIIVVHDILGMLPGEAPRFAKQYVNLYEQALRGVKQYASEVSAGDFPEGSKQGKPSPSGESKVYG